MMKTINKTELTNLLLNAYGFADDYGILLTDESLLEEDTFQLQGVEGETITCLYEKAEIFEGGLLRVIEEVTGKAKVFTVLVNANCEALLD
jgi:hypothetical protein